LHFGSSEAIAPNASMREAPHDASPNFNQYGRAR
jgi:hypothetical protein